jgi:putative heme-binding domain-containing protein
MMRSLLSLLVFIPTTVFAQHVAPTEAKSTQDELKSFTVAAPYRIQLVASEPQIDKPMQMAFDAKGRLWVTTSRHYPFAAEAGKSSDRLFILSDFDVNGLAKSVKVFDDKLNIPIGILPLDDGKSCIVSSCGEILKLSDTDADGKADQREVLFTGFGFKDTHGMTNSFTQRPDGWIYACHGFANDSKVKGRDGHEIAMHSGHTFRFKADGTRIEIVTRGQVNPFGMTTDAMGFLYTADCHSKPITQLIPGACYDSFGKPHDGLGYAPHVTRHDHGSTGLCGLAAVGDQMFIGNVVTNKINADRIVWRGGSPVAIEAPDLLSSSDPWFRPTDLKVGPDGGIYVADFYNKIIGHYEVDLKHPQRDKMRGRIWKLTANAATNSPVIPEEAIKARQAIPALRSDPKGREKLNALLPGSPIVARIALEEMAGRPHGEHTASIWNLLRETPASDTHLVQSARVALRNCLQASPDRLNDAIFTSAIDDRIQGETLVRVLLGLHRPEACDTLLRIAKAWKIDPSLYAPLAEHLGRYGTTIQTKGMVALQAELRKRGLYSAVLSAFFKGYTTSGRTLSTADQSDYLSLAKAELDDPDSGRRVAALQLIRAMPLARETGWPQAILEMTAGKVQRTDLPAAEQIEACETLFNLQRKLALERLTPVVGNSQYPLAVRIKAATLLGTDKASALALASQLKTAPQSLAVAIGAALAGYGDGANLLIESVRKRDCSPSILVERSVRDRLAQTNPSGWQSIVADLTAGLPSPDQSIAKILRERTAAWPNHKVNIEAGKKLFETNCANCHLLNGIGGKVGPNLDGIGVRGGERLLEDILDVSRNVDAAFAATRLDLSDGRVLTGLVLRSEGGITVMADELGKELRINDKEIEKRTPLKASPMPADWGTKLKEKELFDLMGYLMRGDKK